MATTRMIETIREIISAPNPSLKQAPARAKANQIQLRSVLLYSHCRLRSEPEPRTMVHAANSWSSPPPLYSTFPGPDNHARTDPSNERTPLNSQTTRRPKCSYTLKVMIGLLLFIAFTWHCVNDYSNTHRMDVQERIIRARESAVARREQTIQAKEDTMREDEERRKRAGLT
ncbi:hypothetical protein ARMSODRAFT_345667 [Armillaria solidipes]|uniref:Uncharacterized protein n=1 Tax=Armillaria solidipes TaxID=1076256 RepID=A0A2H3B7H0_9AGAR|nr:hypothetical protein ARMSODRAFT_345667 [Armillaria solidipes]